ncbi:MAG: hypothetical protein JWR74_165 [Polaromonas sp.]|nr:hypothetical protein [Polaromonas sp.]
MASALPELTDLNRFFWTSGADGRLRIQRCNGCGFWLHPPGSICPNCLSHDLAPQVVSGLATVQAVTVNHQPWLPGVEVPYAIARVSLDEDPAVYLTTLVVGTPPETVTIGQRVKVRFEPREEMFLPFFEPLERAAR